MNAGQRRYAAWLKSDSNMTFGEWLKRDEQEPDSTCTSCIGTGIGDPHSGSICWSCKGAGYFKPQREYDL